MSLRFVLSRSIYPEACLAQAAEAYRAFCSVTVRETDPTTYCIEIVPTPSVGDEARAAREFLNYLLDIALEIHLSGPPAGAGTV